MQRVGRFAFSPAEAFGYNFTCYADVVENRVGRSTANAKKHIFFVRAAHSVVSCQAVPRREPGHLVLGFSVLVAADCCDMFSGLSWAGTRGRESGASTWCSHYNATAAFSVAKRSWRYNIGGARLGEQPVYKAAVQIGSRRV